MEILWPIGGATILAVVAHRAGIPAAALAALVIVGLARMAGALGL